MQMMARIPHLFRQTLAPRRILSVLWLAALVLIAVVPPGLAAPAAVAGQAVAGQVEKGLGFALLRAAAAGEKVQAPDLASLAELVRFAPELVPALLRVKPETEVRIADWPVAPGVRRDVLLIRHEVYAPGARVLQVSRPAGATGGETVTELPRSRLVFFWGSEAGNPGSGISVSVDPDTAIIESLAESNGVIHQLRPLVAGKPGLHLVAEAKAFQGAASGGQTPSWKCGEEDIDLFPPQMPSGAGASAPDRAGTPAAPPATTSSSSNTAVVAIDTDYPFMSMPRINGDTTVATNYVASLFAQINVMYQRDLQVQLLIGTTFLRTTPQMDPYKLGPGPGGNAGPDQLGELSTYWAVNMGGVTRAVAAMLSGKEPDDFSASGIAWISSLCSSSNGYSFTQVFRSDQLALDASVVGHEIGHNFGSRHTHCYSPPIDTCFSGQPGCYSGATSCPAPHTVNGIPNVTGTMMSYCNMGSCAFPGVSMVFDPRVVAVIQPQVQAAVGNCIGSGVQPPTVSSISPNNGLVGGGTAVTIKGANFGGDATVKLGGAAAAVTNVSGDGLTITATTGAHATGTVDLAVTTGGVTATLPGGYFYSPNPTSTSFYTLAAPCRAVDTRGPVGPGGGPSFSANESRGVPLAGVCGIPASAKAVSGQITVVTPGSAGTISSFPGNGIPSATSVLSFAPGQVRSNNTVFTLASDGTGSAGLLNLSGGSTSIIVDVNGYFR